MSQVETLSWHNGEVLPISEDLISRATHGLHYGTGVWEGIRYYDSPEGAVIFCLQDHIRRLLASAEKKRVKGLPYGEEELESAIIEMVARNRALGLKAGYIRPIIHYDRGLGVNPTGIPLSTAIIIQPFSLADDAPAEVGISSVRRHDPRSSDLEAKAGGNYLNSVDAALQVEEERGPGVVALQLDLETPPGVAEAPGANFFGLEENEIGEQLKAVTPERGYILPGITRARVMEILEKELGILTVERKILPAELPNLKEAFFTGTAMEVRGISSVDGKKIGTGQTGHVTAQLKQIYSDIIHGRVNGYNGRDLYKNWLTLVSE